MAENPVLDYIRDLADKADMMFVSNRRGSTRLDHCSDRETARFIVDRLKERYLAPKVDREICP